MKKPFVFFVALIFLFAAVSVAFAEDNATTPAEGQENELNESSSPELEDNSSEVSTESAENETPVLISELENETDEADNITTEIENETENTEGVFDVINATENQTESGINETATQGNETEANETPSITPDQPVLWGLKRAIERIDLLITFGKSAKAQKGLVHARERLLEVQAMIAAKKLDAAEKSANAYKSTVEEVQKNVENLGDGNSTAELEDVGSIESSLAAQEQEMAEIQSKIRAQLSNLSSEQKAQVTAMLASVTDTGNELKVSVAQKKAKVEVKIKVDAAEQKTKEAQKTAKESASVKKTESGKAVEQNSTKESKANSTKKGKQ